MKIIKEISDKIKNKYINTKVKTKAMVLISSVIFTFLTMFVFQGRFQAFILNIFYSYVKTLSVIVLLQIAATMFFNTASKLIHELMMFVALPIFLWFWSLLDVVNAIKNKIYYTFFPNQRPDRVEKQKYEQRILEKQKREEEAEIARQERINEAGRIGEAQTEAEFMKIQNTTVMKNIYIPIDKNSEKYTEIDVIVVNKVGIYVIEVKNYNGVITGNKEDRNWIKTNNGKATEFYNPIMQNEPHKHAVKKYLEKYEKKVKTLIVFGDKSDISSVKYVDSDCRIMNISEIRRVMASEIYGAPAQLTDEDIKYITEELQKGIDVSDEIKQEHLEYVKTRKEENTKSS